MNKNGNFEKFKKGLKDVIDSFEKAKEWADLSNCLQKVKKQFDQNPGTEIPMKKDLAKRLGMHSKLTNFIAQCLNPDLAVIHQLTLEVYGMIFQRQIELMKEARLQASQNPGQVVNSQSNQMTQNNIRISEQLEWGSDLGLFYSGLFNFYQFAAFEVKDPFLSIIEQYILQLDKELLLSLPGFMICMLPALEDQNAQILKRVENILAKTEECVGTSEFYGEIWKAMLRTNRTRLSAIKYLEKRIPKDLDAARQLAKLGQIFISRYTIRVMDSKVSLQKDAFRESDEVKKLELLSLDDYFYFYYPLKQKLCVNSLLAGLSDSSVYVNRGVLDFLISHAPITGNVNTLQENVRILEGALLTLQKRDFAFLKKFFTWTLGHLEDEEVRPSEDDPAIRTLVPAIQCLLNKFMDKQEISKHFTQNKDKGGTQQHQSPHNIPILILQTLLNDNAMIIEPILVKISVDLIKYIKMYYNTDTKKDQQRGRFIENVNNLFDMVQHQLNSIWMALGQLLSEQIRAISVEYVQDGYSLQAIELIDFCLRDLKLGFERQHEIHFSEQLRPILSRLLSGCEKLSSYLQNLENAIPALELIDFILHQMEKRQGGSNSTQQEDAEHLKLSVEDFNNFYVNICRLMTSYDDPEYNELFKVRFDTFKKASQILNQIQKYSNANELQQMPEWLKMVIECSKTKRAKIVLVSIETFLNILSKQTIHPNDPVKNLQNLIVRQDNQVNIRFDESNSQRTGNAFIYQTLQNTKNPYCTDIIKTLWSLLDEEEDHQKIVTLLRKFDGLLPKIFSEVVTDELNHKDREVKVRAIKKFTIFWKLTALDYPQYKPFYEKDTDLRRYVALHNMLHILEDNDPTLRLSCKSWLSESKNFYRRILDPLLEEFLQNSKSVFVTYSGQIFFYEMYETQIVIQNFGKMRNIILNTQEEMINYLIKSYSTDYILKQFDEIFFWMRPQGAKPKKELKCTNKYLQILVYITLQFIMGQAVQSVNDQLYQESQTVNASACEFMELILKSLEQHKDISNEIAHIIIDPLLRTFRQVIDNQNHAMQVHLLNLLKVIFFQCNFDSPESRVDCERIFKDSNFIDSIVKGMKNEVSFVRYHFISFATTIMPMMNSLIKPQDFTIHIKKFVECFCRLMKCVDVTLYSNQQHQLLVAVQAQMDEGKSGGAAAQNFQNQRTLKNTIKGTTFVGNKNAGPGGIQKPTSMEYMVINQESDIAQVISGLEQVLCYCLGIVKEIVGMKNGTNLILNTSIHSASTEGSVQDHSGLDSQYKQVEQSFGDKIKGLFSSGPFKKGEYIIVNDKQEIREAIYEEFQNIIVSCLFCWNDLPIFTARDYYFTRSGLFPYTSEDEKLIANMIDKSLDKYREYYFEIMSENALAQFKQQQLAQGGPPKDWMSTLNFTLSDYIKQNANQIQRYVIEFLRPLAETSHSHFIEGILLVWMDKKNFFGMNLNKSLEKIIQILQSVRIKPHLVIESIVKFIEKKGLATKKASSNKRTELKKIDIQRESMLCEFLYTYLLYNISQQFNRTEENNLAKIYYAILRFMKHFMYSKHPVTVCWMLEILHILSIKFSPADAYKIDQKLKKEYLDLLTHLLQSTASILSDTNRIEFSKAYGFLFAFSPTVYELLKRFTPIYEQNYQYINSSLAIRNEKNKKHPANPKAGNISDDEDVDEEEDQKDASSARSLGFGRKGRLTIGNFSGMANSASQIGAFNVDNIFADPEYANNNYFYDEKDNISQLMIDLAEYINKEDQECPSFLLNQYFKFFTIITMKSILYPMTQSIVGHTNHDKITSSLSIIVNVILQHLNKKEDGQHQQQQSQLVIRETMTDFFSALMDKANQLLVKPYKREISELFYSDNFFQMSRRTLRKWCKIINHVISDQKDAVFDDLLYKWNTQAGLLTSKVFEIKQKCIALKRVSFLVFSGDIDQYDDKLDLLLKKMTEGFKTNKKYNSLRIELFLLTRVLLLRLSPATLTDALRKLWPHLLNELVSIFEDQSQSDVQLTFEAIKMIELMSSLNIEDFQMNQWIFLVDSYGMKLEEDGQTGRKIPKMNPNQMRSKHGDNDMVIIDRDDIRGGASGLFQPFIVKFMQERKTSFYNHVKVEAPTVDDLIAGKKNQIELRKSSINVDPQFYNDDALETYAIELQYRLNDLNMERTEIDRQNFEALIEKDFIKPEHKYNY